MPTTFWSRSRHPTGANRILRVRRIKGGRRKSGDKKPESPRLFILTPVSLALLRQRFFDCGSYVRIVGFNLRFVGGNYLVVLADQEFVEVPLDIAAGGFRQIFV